jgi:hypothetical protein
MRHRVGAFFAGAPVLARETLTVLQKLASPEVFRKITWENGTKLLKLRS